MSKLLQSGDLDINFDRIFTCKNAYLQKSKPFFDAQGGRAYRNRPFRCRVARSTSTLTAYLHIIVQTGTRGLAIGEGEFSQPCCQQSQPSEPGQAGRQAVGRVQAAGRQQVASRQAGKQAGRHTDRHRQRGT